VTACAWPVLKNRAITSVTSWISTSPEMLMGAGASRISKHYTVGYCGVAALFMQQMRRNKNHGLRILPFRGGGGGYSIKKCKKRQDKWQRDRLGQPPNPPPPPPLINTPPRASASSTAARHMSRHRRASPVALAILRAHIAMAGGCG
jgi:hypothetical protein